MLLQLWWWFVVGTLNYICMSSWNNRQFKQHILLWCRVSQILGEFYRRCQAGWTVCGFHPFIPKGTPCNSFTSQLYQLHEATVSPNRVPQARGEAEAVLTLLLQGVRSWCHLARGATDAEQTCKLHRQLQGWVFVLHVLCCFRGDSQLSKNMHQWFSKSLPEIQTDLPQHIPPPWVIPVYGSCFAAFLAASY